MKRIAVSLDKVVVEMVLEKKHGRAIGSDFKSGGLHDYQASSGKGIIITIKSARVANPTILTNVLRTALTDILGEETNNISTNSFNWINSGRNKSV